MCHRSGLALIFNVHLSWRSHIGTHPRWSSGVMATFFAMIGLLISGVEPPLLGYWPMMLFKGDYRYLFGQTGRIPGAILIFSYPMYLRTFWIYSPINDPLFCNRQAYLPNSLHFPISAFSVLCNRFCVCH